MCVRYWRSGASEGQAPAVPLLCRSRLTILESRRNHSVGSKDASSVPPVAGTQVDAWKYGAPVTASQSVAPRMQVLSRRITMTSVLAFLSLMHERAAVLS